MLKLYINQDPAACEARRGWMVKPRLINAPRKYFAAPRSPLMFGVSLLLLSKVVLPPVWMGYDAACLQHG